MSKFLLTIMLACGLSLSYADTISTDQAPSLSAESISISTNTSAVNPTPQPSQIPAINSITVKPKMLNQIVAYVNKRIITTNEVNTQLKQAIANLKQRGIANNDESGLRSKVLDQLILQQIQLDLASRSGLKTSDGEINDAIMNNEKAQGITDTQMRSELAKQGISYEAFRQQIGNQITMEKLKQREVDGRVSINEDEVNRVLNSETYKNRIDYHLSDIIIGLPEQANQEIISQKEAIANNVYNQLIAGASFEQLSVKYSTAPNALSGGELGWKSNTSLPPMILSQLSTLKVGGSTQPIKLPVGFFIFKLTGIKQHGAPQIVRQYHVRHILIKVNELTSDDEAHQKIISIRDQIMKDAGNPQLESQDFVKLAKQYSDDTSSIKGGDIGWVSKGDTVPQFEQAIFATPVGQISQPVRTPFGWHILQVIETRDSNLANDREKAEIRQDIRDNKAQMLYAEWIRSLREMAYVKINDE